MKKYYFLLLLLFSTIIPAQLLDKTAISFAYRYTGRHAIQGGLEFRINSKNSSSFITGASMLYTSINHQNKFLPEFNLYYSQIALYGVSVNPYAVEPRIGVSLFNLIFINTGYALPIHKERYFTGVTFGIQCNISPVKSYESDFYDKLKMF